MGQLTAPIACRSQSRGRNAVARPAVPPARPPISTGSTQLIVERMQSPVALIPQLAGHIVAAGGKRLRPMLTLGCARLCGYQRRAAHRARRRGRVHPHRDPAARRRRRCERPAPRPRHRQRGLGQQAGGAGRRFPVQPRSFELMVEDGSLRVLEILSRASAVIAEGEVLQLVTANDTATTEAAYLEVIEAKTAALFAAASRIGAVVAERPPAEEEALERFGRNLGIAFQLIDDMLDFSARQSELGKSGRRRFPRRQDHPAGPDRVCPRRRRGARLLAPHARRRASSGRATSNARCGWSSATAPWPRPCAGPGAMPQRPPPRSPVSGRAAAPRAGRDGRVRHRPRLLIRPWREPVERWRKPDCRCVSDRRSHR